MSFFAWVHTVYLRYIPTYIKRRSAGIVHVIMCDEDFVLNRQWMRYSVKSWVVKKWFTLKGQGGSRAARRGLTFSWEKRLKGGEEKLEAEEEEEEKGRNEVHFFRAVCKVCYSFSSLPSEPFLARRKGRGLDNTYEYAYVGKTRDDAAHAVVLCNGLKDRVIVAPPFSPLIC